MSGFGLAASSAPELILARLRFLLFFACTPPAGHRNRTEGNEGNEEAAWCGGQPTFKGTRIMVWIVLEQLDRGLTWQEVVREWDGRVPEEAIGEAIAIAGLVVKHEPFGGFHVGAGRKLARPREAIAA